MTEQQTERFAEALARLAGDEDLLIAMADMVVHDAPPIVDELQNQLDREAMEEAAAAAHKLKGMCSTFETGSPVVELEELVHAARAGKIAEARTTYETCAPQISELLVEIASLTRQAS